MFRILEELLGLYLLYKLIFDLIIPATQTTRHIKKHLSEMQSKMQEHNERFQQQSNNNNYTSSSSDNSSFSKPDKDDYIDFEEVK